MTPQDLPLAGWRVLDLGIITAGAATAALLADGGADVVKIESARYPDPFRGWTSDNGASTGGTSPVFEFTNRNKLGLALDLKTGQGRDLFLRMVRTSDVVVENFRRDVLANLGLDYQRLRAENPRIVLASISSQGETGPDRAYTSYGSTLEATGGVAAITGYADGPPTITGREVNYPDQVVSMFALGAVVSAVLHARRTGEGAHLDISQREVTAFLIGETVIAANRGDVPTESIRRGNADPAGRPQGCYRCSDDRWIAVTLQHSAVEQAVANLVDAAPASTPTLATWVSEQTADEAVEQLRAVGVAAAPVLAGHEVLAEAQGGRGCALAVDQVGTLVKGFPFQSRRTPFSIRNSAPGVGRDTAHVLSELFGMSPSESARLRDLGITK